MREEEVIKILKEDLNFSDSAIVKLKLFSESVIKANQKHNFISKNTESDIWEIPALFLPYLHFVDQLFLNMIF